MPRPATRRPAPIVLPNEPMDTLWEVDESSNDLTPSQSSYASSSRSRVPSSWSIPSPPRDQLRSVFEDDDDEEDLRNVSFPLPPVSLPRPVKRLFSVPRMMLPIHPAPRSASAPSSPSSSKRTALSAPPRKSSLSPNRPSLGSRSVSAPFPRDRAVSPQCTSLPVTPSRRRSDVQRPVSPTSSASSSDNELPRTPTSSTSSLPAPIVSKPYVLAPPPPAEWESAIDELFAEYDYDEDLPSPVKSAPIPIPTLPTRRAPPMPTRRPPSPPVSSPQRESYMSWSPLSGSPASPRRSFGFSFGGGNGPTSPSALPMSPTFARALGSPGFMPTSPSGSDDHFFSSFAPAQRSSVVTVPSRPARRREARVPTTIPVDFLFQAA
ncbi:hypothetical protein BDV93DRAFT_521548 [Ceratobasidium sp. AG-I]|nr:hypothetical protein BDV93DRAFT_521548 [Ceratobasidium sp. AG-I]